MSWGSGLPGPQKYVKIMDGFRASIFTYLWGLG